MMKKLHCTKEKTIARTTPTSASGKTGNNGGFEEKKQQAIARIVNGLYVFN